MYESWIHSVMPPSFTEGKKKKKKTLRKYHQLSKKLKNGIIIPAGFKRYKIAVDTKAQTMPRIIQLIPQLLKEHIQ